MRTPVWTILPLVVFVVLWGCSAGEWGDDDAQPSDDDDTGSAGDDDAVGDDDDTGSDDDDTGGDDDDTGGDDDDTGQDTCGAPDLNVTSPYPISGYWMYGRLGECAWREALEEVHRIGADTVIQFGPHPQQRSAGDLASDATFSTCVDGGQPCYDAALSALQSAHPSNTIDHVYTYNTSEDFSDELLVCSGMDQRIEVGDQRFWRLLLPASDPSDHTCDFSTPRSYDLLLVAGQSEDTVATLLADAEIMDMGVYLGIPTATPHPSYGWEVWSEAEPLCLELLDRVLADYATRHAGLASFAGVYQSTELPASDATVPSVLDWYAASNAVVRQRLPGKTILVSPYMDLRLQDANGVNLSSLEEGIKDIARTDMDVIAPQDGRGTGKIGLYWPYEEDSVVDPRLQPTVGAITYGQAYRGNTRDAYSAASDAVIDLVGEGIAIELWANVEAFEPGAGEPCGYYGDIPRTQKERLDQALTFEGASASKLISFMWDAYYTCQGNSPTNLGEDVATDHARPIVSHAFAFESGGQGGIVLRGYNIVGGDVGLSWYDASWAVQAATVNTGQGWEDPGYGAASSDHPARLEEVWIPFDWDDMAPDFYVHMSVTLGGLTSSHLQSLAY